jgi:hypothetical protein
MSSLLEQYCPIFHTDARESVSPIDLELYVRSQMELPAGVVTGVLQTAGSSTFLHYFTFYTANDGSLGTANLTWDGREYQLQHLVVQVQADAVTGVLFRPHAKSEHYWIRGPDLRALVTDHSVNVYISKATHAQHAVSGTVMRRLGAVDRCEKPAQQDYRVQEASREVTQLALIDGVLEGLKNRVSSDITQIPTVSLNSVKTRMRT